MRSSITRLMLRAAVASGVATVAAGCGGVPGDLPSEPLNLCPNGESTVARLQITPKTLNLRVGSSASIALEMFDRNGELILLCSPPVAWATTDVSVAAVAEGSVRGVSPGKVFIRVTAGGKSDSSSVTVVATTIESISIQRAPASLLVGQTVGLMLDARDTDGNVTKPQGISWRTDNATVATISPNGMLIAVLGRVPVPV